MGCGNGLVETGINPLIATLYPTEKTHYLNILHAWWPGGLVIGGLAVKFVGGGIDLGFATLPGLGGTMPWLNWQWKLVLIVIPCLVYGFMLLGQVFPQTERVESGVSNAGHVQGSRCGRVPAVGLLHAADGVDRAGAQTVAGIGADADGRYVGHAGPGLHQRPDVRDALLRRTAGASASRRSACCCAPRAVGHRPVLAELRR